MGSGTERVGSTGIITSHPITRRIVIGYAHVGRTGCRLATLTLVGIAIACVASANGPLLGVAQAQSSPQSAPAPTSTVQPVSQVTVKLDFISGSSSEGRLMGVLPIRTEFGTVNLQLNRVKAIDFATDDGPTRAIVELLDGHELTGEPLTPHVTLATADGEQTVRWAEIRELRVVHARVPQSLLALLAGLITLAVMEIVLGIDNIIFLTIIAGKLPREQQPRARKIGLAAALGTRLLLLFSLSWLLGLTQAVVTLPIPGLAPDAREISWRDMILIGGGGFLIVKSIMEMHHKLEEARRSPAGTDPTPARPTGKAATFASVIVQIAIIDIVFSLDSVITAVGMVDDLLVMIMAMLIAMAVMWFFAGRVASFVDRFPTVKVLALSFLILIGVLLLIEGMGQHVDKGYVYFAMAFAVGVEAINLTLRPKGVPQLLAEQ